MSSVFLTLAKLPEFKKWLASADGPLQFARHSVRSCGTDHQRGHAAHAGDRLEAANNVLTAMTLVGHKRARDRRLEEEHLARQLDDIGEDTASALQGIDLDLEIIDLDLDLEFMDFDFEFIKRPRRGYELTAARRILSNVIADLPSSALSGTECSSSSMTPGELRDSLSRPWCS